MSFPDLLRVACAVVALALMATCIYAMTRTTADQRLRFGALALIGLVVVAGQLDGLGNPGNWRMPILLFALALALIGAIQFLTRRSPT